MADAKKSIAPRRASKPPFIKKSLEGKSTKWLGWRQANEAINEFVLSSTLAIDILSGVHDSEEIIFWLTEAIGGVAEYSQDLDKCRDDDNAAVRYVSNLRDESEYIEGLLSFLRDVDDLIDEQLGENISQELRLEIGDALEDVHCKGWHMYHVFIGAV